MALKLVGPGKSVPRLFNVIIEIPAHSDPIKYEVDKETGALFVDRFMSTASFSLPSETLPKFSRINSPAELSKLLPNIPNQSNMHCSYFAR